MLLVAVDWLDELWSGVPSLAAPDIRAALGLDYAGVSTALMTVPFAVASVAEPMLLLWLSRRSRRSLVLGGLGGLALGCAVAALSGSIAVLTGALSLTFIASGLATAFAQTALMDADPARRELWMTRWTLAGAAGDLCAPLLYWGVGSLGLGYRGAFALCAAACVLCAFSMARAGWPASYVADGSAAEDPADRIGLRAAMSCAPLVLWTLGSVLCLLLDELLVVFGGLYLRDVKGYGAGLRSAAWFTCSAGATVGLFALERWLATRTARRLLPLSCAISACALALFWLACGPLSSFGALLLLGLSVAPQYPLAQAQAYRALPDHSALVAVVAGVFQPVTLLLPVLLGLVSDRLGLSWAVALLSAQPLALLMCYWLTRGPGPKLS